VRNSRKDELGATTVEYAILISLIAIAIFVAVGLFGTAVARLFDLPPI
jgi:Flp pilus assembly pilin Flp